VADFTDYRTYGWLDKGTQIVHGGTTTTNDLVSRRITSSVNEVLAEKGYALAGSDEPDFLVGSHIVLEGKVDVQVVDNYYDYRWGRWYGPYGSPGYTETRVRQYTEGTLALDIVDPAKNELVWRGYARAEVSADMSPEKREARIHEAVTKILERFPPEAK
jgi:hypothetical protein